MEPVQYIGTGRTSKPSTTEEWVAIERMHEAVDGKHFS